MTVVGWAERMRTTVEIVNGLTCLSSGMTASNPTIAFVIAKCLFVSRWLFIFNKIQDLDVSGTNLLASILS